MVRLPYVKSYSYYFGDVLSIFGDSRYLLAYFFVARNMFAALVVFVYYYVAWTGDGANIFKSGSSKWFFKWLDWKMGSVYSDILQSIKEEGYERTAAVTRKGYI